MKKSYVTYICWWVFVLFCSLLIIYRNHFLWMSLNAINSVIVYSSSLLWYDTICMSDDICYIPSSTLEFKESYIVVPEWSYFSGDLSLGQSYFTTWYLWASARLVASSWSRLLVDAVICTTISHRDWMVICDHPLPVFNSLESDIQQPICPDRQRSATWLSYIYINSNNQRLSGYVELYNK